MLALAACGGEAPTGLKTRPGGGVVRSAIDGSELDSAKLARLRVDAQGCLFVARTADGTLRAEAVPRRFLPFWIPAVTPATAAAPKSSGATVVTATLGVGGGGAVAAVSCAAPAGYTVEHLRATIAGTRTAASVAQWRIVWSRLSAARPLSPATLSREAREVKYELLGARPTPGAPVGLRIAASAATQDLPTIYVIEQAPPYPSSITLGDVYGGGDPMDAYLQNRVAQLDAFSDASTSGGSGSDGGYPCWGTCGGPTNILDTYIPPWSDPDDMSEQAQFPDCSAPRNAHQQAWCGGALPADARLDRIKDALRQMRALGGECATLADLGQRVLDNNGIRIYNHSLYGFAGVAPVGGGAEGWMAISDAWTDVFYGSQTTHESLGPRNLQHTLAHELDHLNGRDHIGVDTAYEDPQNTPHSNQCSGIY